ncbi:MAG TPA: hypothetical protein VGS22_24595 [Thermoanaerobaculia bacterium]|jgi:hypothetical protein|nr:hypothetical protein [Thermoanaerobaculia bacterium]
MDDAMTAHIRDMENSEMKDAMDCPMKAGMTQPSRPLKFGEGGAMMLGG